MDQHNGYRSKKIYFVVYKNFNKESPVLYLVSEILILGEQEQKYLKDCYAFTVYDFKQLNLIYDYDYYN